MKIVIIHGQSHKGNTYYMTREVVKNLSSDTKEIQEFFLPKDGPEFCIGCCRCFLKGEDYCPSAAKTQPVAKAIEWADIVILDSPNYVLEMSGALKNMMDHLAYRWFTHRPHGSMFKKVGIVISSSAGAPPLAATKSMAKQLRWMGIPKVYKFGMACFAAPKEELKPKVKTKIMTKAKKIAKRASRRWNSSHTGIYSKLLFLIFRKMQSAPGASWNPTDRDWWREQGWLREVRPWK